MLGVTEPIFRINLVSFDLHGWLRRIVFVLYPVYDYTFAKVGVSLDIHIILENMRKDHSLCTFHCCLANEYLNFPEISVYSAGKTGSSLSENPTHGLSRNIGLKWITLKHKVISSIFF